MIILCEWVGLNYLSVIDRKVFQFFANYTDFCVLRLCVLCLCVLRLCVLRLCVLRLCVLRFRVLPPVTGC